MNRIESCDTTAGAVPAGGEALRNRLVQVQAPLAAAVGSEGIWVCDVSAPIHLAAPTCAMFPVDGKLGPAQAELLESHERLMLVALRGETPGLSDWEAPLAAAFPTRAALVPACHDLHSEVVHTFDSMSAIAERAAQLATSAGGGRSAAEAAADVAHELLANALLDAPVEADGTLKYAHRREQRPDISPRDACRVLMGTWDGRFYLSVTDRFGRLERAPLVKVLRGLGGRVKVDDSGGGAGLGLRRILDLSDLVAARVVERRATEVLSVVSLGEQRRRATEPKSLYYRIERGPA